MMYVMNQPGLILMSRNKNTTLTIYCGSDWASCSCYLVKFGKSLIALKSKKQIITPRVYILDVADTQ